MVLKWAEIRGKCCPRSAPSVLPPKMLLQVGIFPPGKFFRALSNLKGPIMMINILIIFMIKRLGLIMRTRKRLFCPPWRRRGRADVAHKAAA